MINLKKCIEDERTRAKSGKNISIPVRTKLGNYLEIAKNTTTVIGGVTGSGKSTFVQEMYILHVLDWWMQNKDKTNLVLHIIYFGMERKMHMYVAKWISRAIFLEQGIEISAKRILKCKDLTDKEEELVQEYTNRLEGWDDVMICFEGAKNPTGIRKFINNFAAKHGHIEKRMSGELESDVYISDHENHIVLIITDHIGVLKPEKVDGQRKQNLDLFSTTMREARDLYGFSPIIIQQLNRGVQANERLKAEDVLPKLTDFAETSQTAHDADVVIALLDPWAVWKADQATDSFKYNMHKMKDARFAKFYRSAHILKNSFDSNGINVPLAFHPYYGIFKDMPKKADQMTDADYAGIVNGSYFLN